MPNPRLPLLLLVGLAACDDTDFPAAEGAAVEGEGFTAVQEIVDGNCLGCHTGTGAGGLDLSGDLCATLLDGGYVVAGASADSELYLRVSGADSVMPPGAPMAETNVQVIGDWIDAGADCGGDTGG